MTHEQQKMTKPPWTNVRSWWLLWVAVLTLALVLASLALSQDPAAAKDAASEQYGEATSSPSASASPAKPGTETTTTTPPSDAQNESGGGEAFNPAQEAPRPSAPANSQGGEDPSANTEQPSDSFSQGESGTGNTTAPSVPQAAVEGLRNRLKELDVALKSLLHTMRSVFPFASKQPAQPGTETNTTAPPSDTQNAPVQQQPAPDNAPGSSEGGEIPSGNNAEPPSDPNGGQVPSGNSSSAGDPNAPWPESGCNDPSVLTPQQALRCEIDRKYVHDFGPYAAPLPWGPTYEPLYGPKWNF
jgi:hypothetical protein